jgi:HD-GYP domain-containing protein (c-di-GMP phosphodiesterase class II)
VFDALTSERPYKPAWDNERAFQVLRDLAGNKLDARCVEVLIDNREEVEQIQRRFQENRFG